MGGARTELFAINFARSIPARISGSFTSNFSAPAKNDRRL